MLLRKCQIQIMIRKMINMGITMSTYNILFIMFVRNGPTMFNCPNIQIRMQKQNVISCHEYHRFI